VERSSFSSLMLVIFSQRLNNRRYLEVVEKRKEKVDESDYREELSRNRDDLLEYQMVLNEDAMMEVKMIGMMMRDEYLACR